MPKKDWPVLSPARKAGLILSFPDRKRCWSEKLRPFNVWDKVHFKCDPRHIGEVTALHWTRVTVRWENGWVSECDINELVKADVQA